MKNEKGFYISIDTALLVIVFIAFISVTSVSFEGSFYELALVQKMDDLLLVWAMERNFSEEELSGDFELVFKGKKGEIEIGGKKITILENKAWKKKFLRKITFLDDSLKPSEIRLTVFD